MELDRIVVLDLNGCGLLVFDHITAGYLNNTVIDQPSLIASPTCFVTPHGIAGIFVLSVEHVFTAVKYAKSRIILKNLINPLRDVLPLKLSYL